MVELFGIAVAGKLVLYLVGHLPATAEMKYEFWKKLFTCDLCLGVWVFFSLCGFYRYEFISEFAGIYIPLVSEFLTGAIVSFVVHLISLGWKFKFSEFTIVE